MDLEGHRAGRVALLDELEPGLGADAVQRRVAHVRHRALGCGEGVDRGQPGLEEAPAGGHPHPGHEQDVARRLDLGLADPAPAAGHPPLVAPDGRTRVGPVLGQHGVEPGPAGAVDRDDVVEGVLGDRARPEDEPGDRGGGHGGHLQRRGVGGDLEQGGDRVGSRELGVGDEPPGGRALEEVGVADEPAVEERRLVDDLRVGAQRREGLCGGGPQRAEVVGRPGELDHPAGVLAGEPKQLALLVGVAEGDDPVGHEVGRDRRPLGAAEDDVERADELELAGRGQPQVTGAEDEPSPLCATRGRVAGIEEEHPLNLTGGPDTPAHGQRRRTSLGALPRARLALIVNYLR